MKAKPKAKAEKTDRRKKVLIVDDHPIMREGLAQLVNLQKDMTVCGEAADGHAALNAVASLRPDLVLSDITMPGKNGLELVKDLHAMHPDVRVLVVSMHDESLYVERVLRAGARGYIMKQEGGKKLIEAIRQVLEGKVYVSQNMSAKILEAFSGNKAESAGSPVERLSDREFEVFQLIGQGKGTKGIAERLHLSVKTVEVHRLKIKEKLKLGTSPELVHYAVRWQESQASGKA
jgi:DNA-binding NarL/FixJ family response regulator